jgi:hypothetical protein
MDWIDLAEDSERWGRGCCEHSNEPVGSIKCAEFLDQQLTCEPLKQHPNSWSYLVRYEIYSKL